MESLKKLLSEKQLHIDAIERRIRYVEITGLLGVSSHESILARQFRRTGFQCLPENNFPTTAHKAVFSVIFLWLKAVISYK